MKKDSAVKKVICENKKTICEAKYSIFIAVIFHLCGLFAGYTIPDSFSFLEESVRELISQFMDKDALTFIFKIFVKNLIAAYFTMCLVALFGLIPAIAALFNGLIIGWLITKAVGVSAAKLAVMLIPHGIFELPAMMIAWGIGIWRGLGYRFSTNLMTYKERFKRANKVFFTLVLPLLLVAAIIEGRYHIFNKLFK